MYYFSVAFQNTTNTTFVLFVLVIDKLKSKEQSAYNKDRFIGYIYIYIKPIVWVYCVKFEIWLEIS